MITGFNTDVQYDGNLYHVQTEDRGLEHPFLESLVYVGGTIIAKKSTSYGDQISSGATEEKIAGLLKRQHQVIIAAIKAGRIQDLVRLSAQNQGSDRRQEEAETASPAVGVDNREPVPVPANVPRVPVPVPPMSGPSLEPMVNPLSATLGPPEVFTPRPVSESLANSGRLTLDLDEVISDYVRRSTEQGKLDIRVISPSVFVAGDSVSLGVHVSRGQTGEPEATVTVKIIGTAFKPRVYSARTDRTGNVAFKFVLPSFTAGTAALVIEAQSGRGRGELKHLIRRA